MQALEQVMHVEEREPARLDEKMYFLPDFVLLFLKRGALGVKNISIFSSSPINCHH